VFFRQVLHEDLGCASYVVADRGEAAVIDPKWEIEDYLELADEHGFEIRHILETHNHADHISGHGRLAAATGATIHVSKDAGVEYEHEPLRDGDAVEVGRARIVVLPTPGHRPEHLGFVIEDRSRGEAPWALVTGDSLFVGDIARPDLAVEPDEGARGLFASLRHLRGLGDFVEVWPGHIGGSLCGGAGMSEKPVSTLGFERRFNPLLAIGDEDEFVARLTAELAPQPPNFRRIVELNRGPLLEHATPVEALSPARARELVDAGATLLDGRDTLEYDAAHAPGSVSVTMANAAVGTRAAWVLDLDAPVVVLAAGDAEMRTMVRLLEAVGFRDLRGYVAGGIAAWRDADLPIQVTEAIGIEELARRLKDGGVKLLDVREDDEWEKGHVDGSIHVPYHELRDGPTDEVRAADRPLAVACTAGNRSSIAASLLRRAGIHDLVHVAEGSVTRLPRHGIELVRGS
jgi:glyoxylase-like metal-dependent hydrolase (beta-lactamase superfamily II)/rhodanese-related sulfurtransferase